MQNEITELRNQVRTLKEKVDALMAQISPDGIQAKKFEVVNDDGKVVAVIGVNEDGGVLGIANKDGEQLLNSVRMKTVVC